MMPDDVLIQDPNSATLTQAQLKKVEVAIRRTCDSSLLIFFDEIGYRPPAEVNSSMRELQKRLDQKMVKG